MDMENLKRHKSPVIDQIPAELIHAGGRAIHSKIHKLINKGKVHPRIGYEGPEDE
jgi:hypothetical protein